MIYVEDSLKAAEALIKAAQTLSYAGFTYDAIEMLNIASRTVDQAQDQLGQRAKDEENHE